MKQFIANLFTLVFRDVPSFIGRFLADQWKQFDTFGQLLFVLALGAITVDAAVSYQYGKSITTTHAIGYALLAVVFALLPDIAAREADRGKAGNAAVIGLLGLPLGLVALQSHIGYTGGVRLGEMSDVAFHQAKLDGATKVRDSEATNLDFWRDQHKALSAEKASIIAHNAWGVTSITADALRDEVAALNGKIAAEEKGGRGGRKAGCKAVCEKLKDERTAVVAKIAATERLADVTKKIADLDQRIEATQKVMAKETQAVADTGIKQSLVVHQNGVLGKMAALVGYHPDAETVSLASASSTSVAFMLLAPLLMFAAGRNRKPEYMNGEHPASEEDKTAAAPSVTAIAPLARSGISIPANTHTREIVKTDRNVWADMKLALRPQLPAGA